MVRVRESLRTMIVIRKCKKLAAEKLWEWGMQLSRGRPLSISFLEASRKMRSRHWWCSSKSIMALGAEVTRRIRSSTFSRPRGILCLFWRMEFPLFAIFPMEITPYSPSLCHGGKSRKMRRKRGKINSRLIKIKSSNRVSRCGWSRKQESLLMQNRGLLKLVSSLKKKRNTSSNSGTVS